MTIGRFEAKTKCNVELNNGMILDVITTLTGYAPCHVWREDMHPDGLGYYQTFVDMLDDIDEVEPLYNDEFEPYEEMNEDLLKDTYIVKVNNYDEDTEWEIDEDYIDE